MFNLAVTNLNPKQLAFGFIITLLSRILPHPPNMTAVNGFAVLAGANLTTRSAIAVICTNLLFSDFILSAVYGYPPVGSWTIFALIGYITLVYIGRLIPHRGYNAIAVNISGSLYFWLWTNLGVWITGHLYAHSLFGLIKCYLMALPFLTLSIIGDLLWMAVMILSFAHTSQRLQGASQ